MCDRIQLDDSKQQVADFYSQRSARYDDGNWHPRIARRLVEEAGLSRGQQILDLATGTGMVAIAAGAIVGAEGRVVGVDISTGMLQQARRKVEVLGLENIEFHLADAENLEFPESSFDCIFCSSALIWMSDLPGTLQAWHRLLKPGGLLACHAFDETAFVGGVVAQKVLKKYGVSLLFNQPTGTVEKCHDLLKQARFEQIQIQVKEDGCYIPLEQAQGMWTGNGSSPVLGQHPNPLLNLSLTQLSQAKREFAAELEKLQTEQGIWDDVTVFYVYGRRPHSGRQQASLL
ncbi:MAG: methyltransferase domain-containing protein [Oculatellaceae cyanobacterium Prado106]|jgi:ubiquinone/menaquinone biosynthesis C-methylase UbiE|nr:methyltransferase domain-containing protein [Oculatellaceae cyanobacterium Prado106]